MKMQSPLKEAPESRHFAGFWQDCLQKKFGFVIGAFVHKVFFRVDYASAIWLKKGPKSPKIKLPLFPADGTNNGLLLLTFVLETCFGVIEYVDNGSQGVLNLGKIFIISSACLIFFKSQ